jgi:carbonic anhydrase/acetyltransferase-like protein (isoleucine patch superfamily)
MNGLHGFMGVFPVIAPDAFVAPGAQVIGSVTLGPQASVWYNCVLRGDVAPITVGARSNIQDGSVVHVTTRQYSTIIGSDCLIGHLAIIHGCQLDDYSFVGMGAIVMDGCIIETDGMLAAGGLLTPGKRIPARELWAGRPAVHVRALTDAEIARNRSGVVGYVELAKIHKG